VTVVVTYMVFGVINRICLKYFNSSASYNEPLYMDHLRWQISFDTYTQLWHITKTLKEEMRGVIMWC